jgi:hypothetical protein
LNPLDFYLWGQLKPLCIQLLLPTNWHFTITLWMCVTLSAISPASLNGFTSPQWDVSRSALNFMENILSIHSKCTLSAVAQYWVIPNTCWYRHFFFFWLWGTHAQSLLHLSLTPCINPCGGGVEYLHREPASHKRRRNGTKKGHAIA